MAVTTDFKFHGLAVSLRVVIRHLMHPVMAFSLLSFILGGIVVIITPPLRAPDEAAHFLRAYGIARGDVIPSSVDEQGRKGLWVPFGVHRDFDFFETARSRFREQNIGYRDIISEYRDRGQQNASNKPDVFELYSGSEGYTPIPYIPYVVAALLARPADLDFLGTLYLMRLLGLVTLTAGAAWAISIMPYLRWAFVCIAMLPAALYARAVVSGDGMALVSTMMVAALCLRSTRANDATPLLRQAVWMGICVLSKPPQIAFTVFSLIRRPLRELLCDWRVLALIVVPGSILAIGWSALTGGDVGAWRMVDDTHGLEQYSIGLKLSFMIAHPLNFPRAALENFKDSVELGKQLIGVLGWLDTPLRSWIYPVLAALLLACFIEPAEAPPSTRRRILVMAVATIFFYWLAISLIFYLVLTPVDSPNVGGLQGRYFIVVLPFLAIAIAAALNRGLNETSRTIICLLSVLLSWGAAIEAILRIDWKL